MSSGISNKDKHLFGKKSYYYIEIDMDISNTIIPFSNFFNNKTRKYVYNGKEQISFENKDPEFKEIMKQEFL